MRKRISTIMLSVMTVSMCTVLLASCGKTTVASLSEQNAAASEVVELPALQLVESFAPETDSAIEVRSEQTAESISPEVNSAIEVRSEQTEESIAPEIDSDIEGLSEQIAESIAPEVSTDVELTSEQIAEDLMSHAWEGSLGDEHYSIFFDSDNYARHTLTDSDGEWQGEGMHSWGLEGNKITLFWEDGELTAEYNKGNGNASLVFQDEHGNVGLTLTKEEK